MPPAMGAAIRCITSEVAELQTREGQDTYRRRKAIVEPPNAWIQQVVRFWQFSLTGYVHV